MFHNKSKIYLITEKGVGWSLCFSLPFMHIYLMSITFLSGFNWYKINKTQRYTFQILLQQFKYCIHTLFILSCIIIYRLVLNIFLNLQSEIHIFNSLLQLSHMFTPLTDIGLHLFFVLVLALFLSIYIPVYTDFLLFWIASKYNLEVNYYILYTLSVQCNTANDWMTKNLF